MAISFLRVDKLSFSWPGQGTPLFSGLTLAFSPGWTAITGPNGGGKTTLLKLITGGLQPEGGTISPRLAGGEGLYCPQESAVMPEGWEGAFGNIDGEAGKILALLEIGDDWLFRWETLSGGEKKRLQLAAALSGGAPLLALDEPTNHLDGHSRECIIRALGEYRGIGLLVSHDRELMDRLCGATVFLGPGEARLYPGGAGKALELREADRQSRFSEWRRAEDSLKKAADLSQRKAEEVARAKGRLSLARVSPDDHSEKAKRKLAVLTGRDAVSANQKSRADTRAALARKKLAGIDRPRFRKEGITLSAERPRRDLLCGLGPGELVVGGYRLTFPELAITPDSRIALVGDNGTGKTILVNKIVDETGADNFFYLPQEIPPEAGRRFLESLDRREKAERAEILSAFYRLGGDPGHLEGEGTGAASPGELRKLLIAGALIKSPAFIIMDEPTNYLDISSVQILETALRASPCPLLLVSHDRVFLETLVNETWTLERTGDAGLLRKVHL